MPRRGSRRWEKKQRGREERVIRKLWRRAKGKHTRWKPWEVVDMGGPDRPPWLPPTPR